MNEQQPVVELHNVSKRIGGKTIIDRLSFQVPKGEVFGFLGPNGAGKTTTIRMMVGLMSIGDGDIRIGGHSITSDFEKAIRLVGAIVENPEMYKYLTGYQNLVHFARMSPGVAKERIEEVIRLVGLENRIHDKVKTYSLGMRQRLGVAQALLHRPSLLILDEPTNGLDPAGIRELRDYLRRLARDEGISVVVSSHLLSEMELMCDRVAIIQQGKLVDVRGIKEFVRNGAGEAQNVVFDLEPGDKERAVSVVGGVLGEHLVKLHDDGVIAVAERAGVAEVNEALVRAGIRVYGIRTLVVSLEDKFLEMTGREPIA